MVQPFLVVRVYLLGYIIKLCGSRTPWRAWSRFFRDNEKLEVGDTVKITSLWDRIDYKVIDTKLIYPDAISYIYKRERI